jgi:HSP20 family protein
MALLMRPDPFSTEVSRIFNTLLSSDSSGAALRGWSPAMDLMEEADHYVLKADMPGMAEDDVSIEVNDNVLTISGERRAEQEARQGGWHRVERSFGRFSRSVSLPQGVDLDQIAASFDRGVLEVRIPKPEETKPRRVSIQAGSSPATVEGTATAQAANGSS